jgi:hypothetical protein
MNTLIKFRYTPTKRLKMSKVEDVSINLGAQTWDANGGWAFIQIGAIDGATGDSFHLMLDRETAKRVADSLNKYLNAKVLPEALFEVAR